MKSFLVENKDVCHIVNTMADDYLVAQKSVCQQSSYQAKLSSIIRAPYGNDSMGNECEKVLHIHTYLYLGKFISISKALFFSSFLPNLSDVDNNFNLTC